MVGTFTDDFFKRKDTKMKKMSMEAVVLEVVRNLDGLNLKTFENLSVTHSDEFFTVLQCNSATAAMKLLFYTAGGLSFLAVVDLSFQPSSSSTRRLQFRLQEKELEEVFATSSVQVVSSVERMGFTHAYATLEEDLLAD